MPGLSASTIRGATEGAWLVGPEATVFNTGLGVGGKGSPPHTKPRQRRLPGIAMHEPVG